MRDIQSSMYCSARFIRNIFIVFLVALFSMITADKTYAASDIIFSGLQLMEPVSVSAGLWSGEVGIYQYSSPEFSVVLENFWPDDLYAWGVWWGLATGYITCENTTIWGVLLYQSPFANSFLVQAGTQQVITNLSIPNQATQVAGDLIELSCTFDYNNEFALTQGSIKVATIKLRVLESPAGRFDVSLWIAKDPIKEKLDAAVPQVGAQGIQDFIFRMINSIIIPLAILIGVLLALFGFYTMLFSDSDDQVSKGMGYVGRGVLGIIVMMLAPFVADTLYNDILSSGQATALSGVEIAAQVYDGIVYPILKMFMFLALGGMFLVLVGRVFSFLGASSDEIQTKSRNIIVAVVVGMLVILWSNELIEFVYGTEQQIRNQNVSELTDIGQPLFSNSNIPLFYEIVRWIMAIAVFAILAIIIYQTFMLLIKPDDEARFTSIKNNIVYVFVGVMVIGAWYLITNFLILN